MSRSSDIDEAAAHLAADQPGGAAARWPDRLPFYYGWVNVVVAALAMLATLPGRTQGLGLCTEPLLEDLQLDRGTFAQINLWATLLGALFCLPAGQMLDRFGTRITLAAVTCLLGLTVWSMSAVQSVTMLFALVLLTRGLGQSALSVVSIAMVGKWFRRRISVAMSVYSVLITMSFATAFGLVGRSIRAGGWRTAWWEIAMALLVVFLPLAVLLVRSTPEACGIKPDDPAEETASGATGFSLAEAVRTPAFWIFAVSTSIYGLVASGMGLFNQAILAERGFDAEVYHNTLVLSTLVSLGGQFACGCIGWFWPLRRIMALAMFLYAGALFWLPNIETLAGIRGYAVVMGLAGGIITVVFFAVWSEVFGRAHLGRIQGAAQMLTVLASAVGPVIFAECFARSGSYTPAFYTLAPIVLTLGVGAWFVPTPARKPAAAEQVSWEAATAVNNVQSAEV
jgi:MFS family permease